MPGCCFTGYRPEKSPFPFDSGNRDYIEFENRLISAITAALGKGIDTFYCGGARGFDLLSAELLLMFRQNNDFKLIMALPHKDQEKCYPPEWHKRYCDVLAAADEIVYVSEEYYKGCFFERNHYMVDRSEMVIAYYDGRPGGTRETLAYAKKAGIEIVNIAKPKKENLNYTIFEVIEYPEEM